MFNLAPLRAVVHIVAAIGKSAGKDVDLGTGTALTDVGLDSGRATVANHCVSNNEGELV